MTADAGLPAALRDSAVPRWSHRDPVEGGNPFPLDDDRHRLWELATRRALEELARIDMDLAREPQTTDPVRYPTRVVDLAARRFDVWSRRALAVVNNAAAVRDYERWLGGYVDRWVGYVADTVPRVPFGDAVRERLAARAATWAAEARARHPDPARPPGTG